MDTSKEEDAWKAGVSRQAWEAGSNTWNGLEYAIGAKRESVAWDETRYAVSSMQPTYDLEIDLVFGYVMPFLHILRTSRKRKP